jgi:hypothetical protein
MIDQIYEKILARLQEVDGLKYIDLQMGQLEMDKPPVSWPCALIDIALTNCEDIGGGIQLCKCVITIVLGFSTSIDQTASIYPEERRALNMQYFKVINDVYKQLQGYYDNEIDRLSRRSLSNDLKKDTFKVSFMPFETEFQDLSAAE